MWSLGLLRSLPATVVVKNKRVVDFLVVVSYDGSGIMVVPILSVTVEVNVVVKFGSEKVDESTLVALRVAVLQMGLGVTVDTISSVIVTVDSLVVSD